MKCESTVLVLFLFSLPLLFKVAISFLGGVSSFPTLSSRHKTPLLDPSREPLVLAHPFTSLYDFPPHQTYFINVDLARNISEHLERRFGGTNAPSCYSHPAVSFLIDWQVPSLDDEPRCIALGIPHTFTAQALDSNGEVVCSGGDFIESLLEGQALRSRLRFQDGGDGTYTFTLHLPDDPLLVGPATLTLFHLWSGLGGVMYGDNADANAPQRTVYEASLHLRRHGECLLPEATPSDTPPLLPPSESCRSVDFMASPFWEGHWVAQPKDDDSCKSGACTGFPRGVLSTSWVYRLPQCTFHLYAPHEARKCLNGAWFFASGDSNGPDTVSNLVHDTLGLQMGRYLGVTSEHKEGGPLQRSFDWVGGDDTLWDGGEKPDQESWLPVSAAPQEVPFQFHATHVWSAGVHECCGDAAMCWGISVIKDASWREKNAHYLEGMGEGFGPDILFINSGLHDGVHYLRERAGPHSLSAFVADLEETAVPWWNEMADTAAGGNASACRPRMIWRHTVASAGPHRKYRANPQSMAIFNRFTTEALIKAGALGGAPKSQPPGVCTRPLHTDSRSWRFLDMYDLTFPFHFNLDVSDGGHFGRHFCEGCDSVDRMQLQVLLNGICGEAQSSDR